MQDRVDDNVVDDYNHRSKTPHRFAATMIPLIATLFLACTARSQPATVPIAGEGEQSAINDPRPERPLWIIFDWEAREREARYTGKGAARIAPPNLARLDLFGPRGESYLTAVVVDGEVKLPRDVDPAMVPPPSMLWGTLGIFRPPSGGDLVASRQGGKRTQMEYRTGADRWQFEFESGHLRKVEWHGANGARKTVELKGKTAADLPREAIYRDWAAFTELKIKVGEVEVVDSFPPEIWQLHDD